MKSAACICLFTSVALSAPLEENLVPDGGFEKHDEGRFASWSPLWTRDPGVGSAAVDTEGARSGASCARVEHRGAKDWSFNSQGRVDVKAGDILVLEAWLRIEGAGSATPCATARAADGEAVSWSLGSRTVRGPTGWRRTTSRFVIPRGVVAVLPRVIGEGRATVWIDDVTLVRDGTVADRRGRDLPDFLSAASETLEVRLRVQDAALEVTDRRTGRSWRQDAGADEGVILEAAVQDGVRWTWLDVRSGLEIRTELTLDEERPELSLSLSADGELHGAVAYPHPFLSREGDYLVVPMNEGISYPVGDPEIGPLRLIAYGGHGICMGFWGVTSGTDGHMAILETSDDAAIHIHRREGRLCVGPEWDSERGAFGYTRRLRYVFFDDGGHVAMCKRYRAHAREVGLLRTLEEKRSLNPHVDLLIGAVNVWCWDGDPLAVVRELRSLGIERILWSNRAKPDVIRAMNQMEGVLTSRYDIYQDLMDPQVVKEKLRGVHADWTQRGWPEDLMLDERGEWRRGWRVRGKDGAMYPCGVLCDRQAIAYARDRVAEELKTHPYRCRFIDTTTASPWRECYDPSHPMTRRDSRRWKMELLRLMSEEMRLVTGSETGHEAAVPYVHYFEGMLSLGPYRVPDAGRNMIEPVLEVPERVARFQLGEKYRLPLWELVYHDCVVAQWYWGDYNNKLPSIWGKRDLFNILYATPPMFMFNRAIWEAHKERFARTYRDVCPLVRRVGYQEMTDHRFLTADRGVQQTAFSGGLRITVNFTGDPFRLPAGAVVEPRGYHLEEPDDGSGGAATRGAE
ncbi:MAG: hypothetical protein JXA90_13225 [Planctomycetes bacterium]|nr:hypothetical protein [Planctomycetota bacterium]